MPTPFRRYREIRADAMSDGKLSIIASTSDPCDMGGWREVLVHGAECIDHSAARALLVNHDPNQIAGTLDSIAPEGAQVRCGAALLKEATLSNGVRVSDAIACGALRGISVGYAYDRADTAWEANTKTLTVKRWRLLEVSLTPIPADPRASLRSVPFDLDAPKDPPMTDPVAPTAADLAAANARASKAEMQIKLRSLADKHGVDCADLDLSKFDTEAAGLTALLERKATAERAIPGAPVVKVTADAGDKLLGSAVNSLYRSAGIKPEGDDAELAKKHQGGVTSLRQILVKMAEQDGVRGNDIDVAAWAAAHIDLRTFGRRDAANKITAGFSNILANVAHKTVLVGLNGYNAATWQLWATQRAVPNFLAVTNAGLASGRLVKTPEGEAFPELSQKDGGYSASLGLYGATVSLTMQTLVNDQLGLFMAELRRAGAIAALTIDRRVYEVLMNATWTNDLSTSAPIATATNLDKPRAALKSKLSPAGEKMGVVARFLLHDPASAVNAQMATGAIYAPGQSLAPSLASRSIVPVESHWIGDTALKSGVATTDYYLAGDPSVVDTVLVNFLEGVGLAPIITPFDAGAVAAEKWKILVPFEATVATHTDSAGNARISGMQKATA